MTIKGIAIAFVIYFSYIRVAKSNKHKVYQAMAKVIFKSYNPNDNLLLPPCLGDYLPGNHPARVVSAIIDRLDISEIEAGYAGGGRYRAQNCTGCPLRGLCYKGMSDRRTIEVNHRANAYRAEAKRLLASERGLYHRSNRPIEPEAVFGDIKQNHGFKRFKLKSNTKVKVEFGLVALAHNLRKYIAVERMRSNAVSCCL